MNRASMSRKIPKNSSFLPSKETDMYISDVPVSPAKKSRTDMSKEPRLPFKKTEVHLFGVSIPLSSPSSMETDEELKSTYNRLEDPKKDFVSTTLCLYDETWPCGNADYPKVTCAPRNEQLTEQTRTIKETKEDETGQWTIKKELTNSDVTNVHKSDVTNVHCRRLTLARSSVEEHIMKHLPPEDSQKIDGGKSGITVKVYDHDTGTEHELRLAFQRRLRNYVLKDGWFKTFVERRGLKEGDEVGLFWECSTSKLHFSLLSRAIAKAPAEDPKKDIVSTPLCLYDETWPCGIASYPKVTCAPRNEQLIEQTRTIKETKEDAEQYETGQWTIKKELNKIDIFRGLYLSKADVERHILRHLSEDDQKKLEQGDGITVNVYDHDSDTTHKVLLVRLISKVIIYYLKDSWRQDFVYRRSLRIGDKIGLSWDSFQYKLRFHVLSRATTKPPPEERR